MANQGEIEISVRDVNDVEARVFARYVAESDDGTGASITLRGTLRGPHSELARTLPAVFQFRNLPGEIPPTAEAIVTDPCTWSLELPLLYHCDVVAELGDRIVAEYHGPIGFRRASK